MKTIDLTKRKLSLAEILALAKSGSVLIHSTSGDDFLLEQADEFDREVAALGNSRRFMSFLDSRSKETGDISISDVRRRRGIPRRRNAGKKRGTGGACA